MQDGRKAVWTITSVSVAFFPNFKQNFIAYRSSKVSWRPDCIFEIHQLWQSDFSRVYSNCCCSCSFEPEIIKIGQSSHKMDSNNILNFQESMTILNAGTKKSGNLLKAPRINISSVQTQDLIWKTCREGWTIGTERETERQRGSRKSVLTAWLHDDHHENINLLFWLTVCKKTEN